MKLITRIYLSVGLILLFFAIVTFSYLRQANKVEADIKNVMLSADLLRESELIQKSLLDMETGFRGYLIAENESFLEPYYRGRKDILLHAKNAGKLLNDPFEIRLMNEINSLSYNWAVNFADVIIEAKRRSIKDKIYQPQFDSVYTNMVKAGYGKNIMDGIRHKFDSFDRHNNSIKNEQVTSLNSSLNYTRFISIALTSIAILMGIVTAYVLAQTIKRRLNTMIDMAHHISQGDFEVKITDAKNDEMSRLSESLNVMAGKLNTYFTNLTKTNKELDQFAYVVSHDLKAPLRAINNLAEWISEDLPDADAEIKQNLQLMRGRAHRMENLINGILEYSKVGRKAVPVEKFSVKELLEEIIDSLAPPPNINIELPEKAPVLTSEKILMQQVFTNLISNGIKYNNKPTGNIKITVQQNDGQNEYIVEDNGPGIPEIYHDRIFGIFQTMEARDTRESTGVGLAIVKKIIEEKGGSIRVESAEDLFTRFIFTWPNLKQPFV